MQQFPRFLLLVLMTLLVATACTRITTIKNIQDHPRDYAGKQVTVEGQVQEVFSLIVFKYFTLDDDTGSITVMTDKVLPKKGERLRVTGRVEEAFSLGAQSLTVIVESKADGDKPARP